MRAGWFAALALLSAGCGGAPPEGPAMCVTIVVNGCAKDFALVQGVNEAIPQECGTVVPFGADGVDDKDASVTCGSASCGACYCEVGPAFVCAK